MRSKWLLQQLTLLSKWKFQSQIRLEYTYDLPLKDLQPNPELPSLCWSSGTKADPVDAGKQMMVSSGEAPNPEMGLLKSAAYFAGADLKSSMLDLPAWHSFRIQHRKVEHMNTGVS